MSESEELSEQSEMEIPKIKKQVKKIVILDSEEDFHPSDDEPVKNKITSKSKMFTDSESEAEIKPKKKTPKKPTKKALVSKFKTKPPTRGSVIEPKQLVNDNNKPGTKLFCLYVVKVISSNMNNSLNGFASNIIQPIRRIGLSRSIKGPSLHSYLKY